MYAIIATGGKQYKVAEGFTSIREKQVTTRKTDTDSSIQQLRSKRSTRKKLVVI